MSTTCPPRSHATCRTVPDVNFGGSKTAAYCTRHAPGGMVDVCSNRCYHHKYAGLRRFGVIACNMATNRRQHTDVGLIGDKCTRRVSLNVSGCTKGAYCNQHADEGAVDGGHKRCSQDTCNKIPPFKVKGGEAAA